MSVTWHSDDMPAPVRIGPGGWIRATLKGLAIAFIVFGGLAVLLLVRVVERPLFGFERPWTPWLSVVVCRLTLMIFGFKLRRSGTLSPEADAFVANHATWIDIFVLNALGPLYFVAKSEVAKWPGIGWLARATGTVFVSRSRADATQQRLELRRRVAAGHRILFFPEGTSTDGQRVLRFRSSLFDPFVATSDTQGKVIQPISVRYTAPPGQDKRLYGWWSTMDFFPHLVQTLSLARQGQVETRVHPPLDPTEYADRKTYAAACETVVRTGFDRLGAASDSR